MQPKSKMVVVEVIQNQNVPWGRVDEFDYVSEARAFLFGCRRAQLLDLQEIRVSLQMDDGVIHLQAASIECMLTQLELIQKLRPWSSEQKVIDAFIAARGALVETSVAPKPDADDGGYW